MSQFIASVKITRMERIILEKVIAESKLDTWCDLVFIGSDKYIVYDLESDGVMDFHEALTLIDEGVDHSTLDLILTPEELAVFYNFVSRMLYL